MDAQAVPSWELFVIAGFLYLKVALDAGFSVGL